MIPVARREAQVAGLVAEGLPNKEIAARLSLTTNTVKAYIVRIFKKHEVSNRVQLANWWHRRQREAEAV